MAQSIAKDLLREITNSSAPIAIDLDGTLRPLRLDTCATSQQDTYITPTARNFLHRLRKFVIVTSNMTTEAWILLAQVKKEFGDSMLETITPLTTMRTIIGTDIVNRNRIQRSIIADFNQAPAPVVYCVTDKEDRAFIRDVLTMPIDVRGTKNKPCLPRSNVHFATDPIEGADFVLFTGYQWLSRKDMHSLCATLTLSSSSVSLVSASIDGAHYTTCVNSTKGASVVHVPGMKCIIEDIMSQFHNVTHVHVGKPYIEDEQLAQCEFMIGDSFITDACQPIAPRGKHIIVEFAQMPDREAMARYVRHLGRETYQEQGRAAFSPCSQQSLTLAIKKGLTDYEISDLGALLM